MAEELTADKIKKLIVADLKEIARRGHGLRDANFGTTQLVGAEDTLPCDRTKRAELYEKLIWKHIDDIMPPKAREALLVKLNIHDNYSDPRSLVRMSELGRTWGYAVSIEGKKVTSRTPENYWRMGLDYLATLISEEIVTRARDDDWLDLMDASDEVRPSQVAADEELGRRSLKTTPAYATSETTEVTILSTGQPGYDKAAPATMLRLPRAEVIAIPISPAILDALESARQACEAADRKFVTPHLLLALLNLPQSKVAACFDQVESGLAQEWRELLIAYHERAIQDEEFGAYRKFDWDHRGEVWRAKQLALHDNWPAVDDLYLLLGVLNNQWSKTRRELAEYLGAAGYERLCQVADRMRAADTPGSESGIQ